VIGIDEDLVIPIKTFQFMKMPSSVGKVKRCRNGRMQSFIMQISAISPFINLSINSPMSN